MEEGNRRGDLGGWATGRKDISAIYKKYLNAKDCPVDTCMKQYQTEGPKTISGKRTGPHNWLTYGLVVADGTQFYIVNDEDLSCNNGDGYCFEIRVDINGQKGPNQYGRDYFVFTVYEDNLLPCCQNTDCNPNNATYTGFSCARKVLRENAMNY